MTELFRWDDAKNDKLILERGISFDEIVACILGGLVKDITDHPDPARKGRQMIFVVERDEYVYLVPFEVRGDHFFLRTVIPSRKATKKYLGGSENEKI
jgi:uncharacterized DUF497 family protein